MKKTIFIFISILLFAGAIFAQTISQKELLENRILKDQSIMAFDTANINKITAFIQELSSRIDDSNSQIQSNQQEIQYLNQEVGGAQELLNELNQSDNSTNSSSDEEMGSLTGTINNT